MTVIFIIIGITLFALIYLFSSMLAMGLALELMVYWEIEDKIPNFHFWPILNTFIGLGLLVYWVYKKLY